jgi:hypothetical protein
MKRQIVKKVGRFLLIGSLLTGMTYASSTLATKNVSAATCDCSSLASAAYIDCGQRFGSGGIYPVDCSESGGELFFAYFCSGDPGHEYLGVQSCQL